MTTTKHYIYKPKRYSLITMKRLRKVRKWGNTHVVALMKPDLKDLKLSVGDEVDISDLVKEVKEGEDKS